MPIEQILDDAILSLKKHPVLGKGRTFENCGCSGNTHGYTAGTILVEGTGVSPQTLNSMADHVRRTVKFDPKKVPEGLKNYDTFFVGVAKKGLFLYLSDKAGKLS